MHGKCKERSSYEWILVCISQQCSTLQGVRSIAAGGQHTVAVADLCVYSWGSNSSGQLGTRTFRDKEDPTEIKDLAGEGVYQVACGAEHTLFLCRCSEQP